MTTTPARRHPTPPSGCRRRSRPAVAALGAVVAGVFLLGACGGSDEPAAAGATTTLTGAAAISTPPDGPCITRVPGQALSEAEAQVRFSATGVCPSYVTVNAGTKVRWTNDHNAPVTVTLAAGGPAAGNAAEAFEGKNPATGGAVVFREAVAAGATFAFTPQQAGSYYFRLDLIPTFLGTLEVR